ncbi:lipid-A-disaccharide synthase [Komarekiella sp. 'clone 1']|uniref:Lipid-A-disaccharide synthase n=1 Tax=Komarekiella delphini-convector SJRDD-AB1 TaxID=2593771 RepID=A0AA40VS22_9NOST|nr:lipid-A-disaccharide synthase [Komarekiella delphini-convector]MBD6617742.1 lipid-A-disaccharide synthase [Komarekiella delphini-convector SJRDD-AB1]
MTNQPSDILILSNGPGEITTWVRPVVKALRQKLGDDRSVVRISVVLSPCPNASGKEAAIALSYPEVDRVQGAEHFWQFLLWGKTFENWDWRSRGVVVFLGGDQIFPVAIGKKLGYKTVVYAEWEARWHNLIDRFAVMKPEVAKGVSQKYAHKFTVVGDLMIEAQGQINSSQSPVPSPQSPIIGILPGSKAAKLAQGVPLTLAIAEYVHAKKPQTRFVIPVAPTLDLQTLASFSDPQKNPFVKTFDFTGASLIFPEENTALPSPYKLPTLKTGSGLIVELWEETPAYDLLSQCCICLTTVGANTAELGSLAVPMIVLLPTQQLDAMRSWDGLPGLLANLPGVGSTFAKLINWFFLRRKGLLAWPNIWAQAEIVPELVGKLQPQEIGEMVLDFLAHPEKLDDIRAKLHSIRGESGAASKIAQIVCDEIEK